MLMPAHRIDLTHIPVSRSLWGGRRSNYVCEECPEGVERRLDAGLHQTGRSRNRIRLRDHGVMSSRPAAQYANEYYSERLGHLAPDHREDGDKAEGAGVRENGWPVYEPYEMRARLLGSRSCRFVKGKGLDGHQAVNTIVVV